MTPIFPRFAEAVRRGLLFREVAPDRPLELMSRQDRQLNLAIPSFDFTGCSLEVVRDRFDFFCSRESISLTPNDEPIALCFGLNDGDQDVVIVQPWLSEMTAYSLQVDGRWMKVDEEARPAGFSDFIAALIWMLENPEITYSVADPASVKRENFHRRAKNLRGLQPANIVYLHKTVRIGDHAAPAGDVTGSPKAPHDRREHQRFYKKSGKTITVRASKIHGGGGINYLVRP